MFVPDSRRAWTRLAVAVLIGSLGSVGMWSVVVTLPAVQAEFGVARAAAMVDGVTQINASQLGVTSSAAVAKSEEE